MTKRGPRPTPTAKKELNGNPGRRKLNDREPRPEPELPICPAWLPHGAKLEFRRLAKHLYRLRLVSKVEPVLPVLALNLWRWREAEEAIEEKGTVMRFVTKAGDEIEQQRPEVAIAKQYQAAALKIAAEYGLTPSSRTRVEMLPEDEEANASNFLFGDAADSNVVNIKR